MQEYCNYQLSMRRSLIYSCLFCLPALANAQVAGGLKAKVATAQNEQPKVDLTPKDWYLRGFAKDTVYGINVQQAYTELLKGKQPAKVIVAVLDVGIDTSHTALKGALWTNKKEIAGNGIDDDKNGYIDDVHGWNFLGGKKADVNVESGNLEADREYVRLTKLYKGQDTTLLKGNEKVYLDLVRKYAALYKKDPNAAMRVNLLKDIKRVLDGLTTQITDRAVTFGDVYKVVPAKNDPGLTLALWYLQTRGSASGMDTASSVTKLYNSIDFLKNGLEEDYPRTWLTAARDYRDVIYAGQPKAIGNYYGNNNLNVGAPDHGTHVAGIIGAVPSKESELKGIAPNAEIMGLRVLLAGGDEYDQDIANAIRYAVNNGAKIINMSFGKYLSPQKKLVDEAIRYAAQKNVLLIRGAGNDGANIDVTPFYPSQFLSDGTVAKNVITVGATDMKGNKAGFSNYGLKSVDVFAPGVKIYSTVSGGKYAFKEGTSMASPVVAGAAALILSYYQNLTALQLKDILMKSVTKPVAPAAKGKVLADDAVSGGIINVYEALKLAAQIKS
jgi:subtilisin family serine protease